MAAPFALPGARRRGYVRASVPAFVAPLIGFALGVVLAWLGAAAPRRPPPWGLSAPGAPPWAPPGRPATAEPRGRPLVLAALFSTLVFTPICAYFLVFAPDWSFAYLVDPRRVPSAVDLLLLTLDGALVPAGCLAGARLAERRSLRATAVLAGAPLAVATLAVLALSPRLAIDATYRQVQGDFGGHPVAGGPLGYALLWMGAMLAAGFAITARALLTRPGETPARQTGLRPLIPEDPGRPDAFPASYPPAGPAEPDRPGDSGPAEPPAPRRLGAGRSAPPARSRLGPRS